MSHPCIAVVQIQDSTEHTSGFTRAAALYLTAPGACPQDNAKHDKAIGDVYPKCLFFFFQAEDGIRDVAVTGVQTCALPISSGGRVLTGARSERRGRVFADPCDRRVPPHSPRVGSGPRVAAGCAYRAPEWRHGDRKSVV